jgi:hypothetical protein
VISERGAMKKRRLLMFFQAHANARSVFGFGVGHVTRLCHLYKSTHHKQDRKSNNRALFPSSCVYFYVWKAACPKKISPAAREYRFQTTLVLFLGN